MKSSPKYKQLFLKYAFSWRIYCLYCYLFSSLKKLRRPTCWQGRGGALGNGGGRDGLQRVGRGLNGLEPAFQHRRRRDDADAQRAVHALAGDFGAAICRGDDDFHATRGRANQLRRLRVDDGGSDGDTQRQHKTQQHPTRERCGAAQSLEQGVTEHR